MLPCRVLPLLSLLIRSLLTSLRSRRDVTLENLALRHQLQVAPRTNPSPRLTNPDRLLWIWLREVARLARSRMPFCPLQARSRRFSRPAEGVAGG